MDHSLSPLAGADGSAAVGDSTLEHAVRNDRNVAVANKEDDLFISSLSFPCGVALCDREDRCCVVWMVPELHSSIPFTTLSSNKALSTSPCYAGGVKENQPGVKRVERAQPLVGVLRFSRTTGVVRGIVGRPEASHPFQGAVPHYLASYQGLRSFYSLNPRLFSFTPPAWPEIRKGA